MSDWSQIDNAMRDVCTVGCGTHLVPVVVGDARALRVVLGKPPVHDSLGVVRTALRFCAGPCRLFHLSAQLVLLQRQ